MSAAQVAPRSTLQGIEGLSVYEVRKGKAEDAVSYIATRRCSLNGC